MSEQKSLLSPNELAFIGLSNEYCAAMEQAPQMIPTEFGATMLRLLPRIYISASSLDGDGLGETYIDPAMDEDMYNAVRSGVESVLGEHDVYLEVFEEDMKYSDTPIAASISEGLTDIMQPLYNFLEVARNAPEALVKDALAAVAEDFRSYWSQILCNALRALNSLVNNQLL